MNVVLITGASSGMGAAMAIEFADAGWNVMAAGRDEGRLEEVADVSDKISTWAGDLVESEDCDELVSDTIDEYGAIDCLINSAGVLPRGNAEETSDDDWRETMAINLDVPFYLSRAALPHLLKTSGSIINMSSLWGLRAGPRVLRQQGRPHTTNSRHGAGLCSRWRTRQCYLPGWRRYTDAGRRRRRGRHGCR